VSKAHVNVIRPLLFAFLAVSCFDPLYETGPGRSWVVCCRAGLIDTCECLEPDMMCMQQITACALDRCVSQGACPGGTSGGAGAAGGSGHGGGSATAGGASAGGAAGGAGTAGGAGAAGGAGTAGGATAGGATAGGATAGGTTSPYEPCCTNGRVGSCACSPQGCDAPAFRACAMGTCVAANLSCP